MFADNCLNLIANVQNDVSNISSSNRVALRTGFGQFSCPNPDRSHRRGFTPPIRPFRICSGKLSKTGGPNDPVTATTN